jgi:hypothetical protein
MKKLHLFLSLVAVLLSLLSVQDMTAKTEPRQDALYIFRNDGGFDFFFYGDIDRIAYSKIDTLGIEQPDYVVQEVWALDTVYRIPLTAIDSVAFVTPENKVWPDVFCPDDRIADYIIDGDSIWWIRLAHNTPADLLPTVGGKMLIDADVSPFIPNGFGGRVAVVEHEEDGWLIATEPTPIADIFERLVVKGAGATPGAQAQRRAPQRSLSGDEYGVPEITLDLLSFEKEFTLANSVISSPDNDYFSFSADLTGTWKPKCDADLTLRACLFVDVPSLSFKFDEKSIWWYEYENSLSLEGSLSSRLELPLIKKKTNLDGLEVELSAGPYIEGSISGYKISSTHKKEQEIRMTAYLFSKDFYVDHGGMIVADPTVNISSKVYQDTTEYEGYLPFDVEDGIQPPNTMSIGVGLGFKACTELALPLEKVKKVLPDFLLKYMQQYAQNQAKDTVGFKCEAGLDLGAKVDMQAPWHVFLWENPPLLESESVFKQLDEDSEFTASLYWKYGVSLKLGPWTYSEPKGEEMKSRPRGLVPSISGARVVTDTEQNPIRPYVKRFISTITRNLIYPVDIGFVVFDEDKEIVVKQCDLSWYSEDIFNQNLPYFKNGTYQFTMNIDPGKGEPVTYTAYPMVRLGNGHELLVYEGDCDFLVEAAAFDIPQRVITVGPQSGMVGGEYVGSMEVEVIPNMENVEVKTEDTWLRNLTWSGHLNELSFFWDDLPDGMRSRRGVIRLMGLSQKGEELVEDSIVVVQSTAYVDVEPKKLTFPKEGGTQTVTITETSLTNIEPSIVSENIHVSLTDNMITVTADPNTNETSRYVWIYLNGIAPDGRLTSIPSIEVTQEGTGEDPSGGEVYNFNWGHYGGNWGFDIPENNLTDLRFETSSSSMLDTWFVGDDYFMVWCNNNYSSQKRTGTVKLQGTDSSGATVTLITVNVEQKQYSDVYEIKILELGITCEVKAETESASNPGYIYTTTTRLGFDYEKYDESEYKMVECTLEGNVMHITYNDNWYGLQCSFDVLNWDEIDDNTLDGECLIIDNLQYTNGSYGSFEANGSLEIDEGWYDTWGWDWWIMEDEDDYRNRRPVKSMQYEAFEGTGLAISNFHKDGFNYISDSENTIRITLKMERKYIYDE